MNFCMFLLGSCVVFAHNEAKQPDVHLTRAKRDAAGALLIQTNHAQPIHADVKPENSVDGAEKVTSPNDAFYELKSLRKSSPLTNKLDLIRSVSRVATLAVLVVTAIMEFYPLLHHLYYIAYSFMYFK